MNFDEDDDTGMDNEDLPDGEERSELENRHKKAKHPLTAHLDELTDTLKVLFAYPESEDELVMSHIRFIEESLMLIKAKLYSALRSDSYLVCMQNAAIIRSHAEYLLVSSHNLKSLQSFDKEHVSVFREEMEEFRNLFNIWAREIKAMDKEDFEDEWGLF